MGFRDWIGYALGDRTLRADVPVDQGGTVATLDLQDIVDRYDIVDVGYDAVAGDPYIIATDRPVQLRFGDDPNVMLGTNVSGPVDLRELGSAAPSPFTSFMRQEYNTVLQGNKGLQKYDVMRRSDGTVRGTLRAVKTPALGARWFVEPASDKKADKTAAEFVWCCLTEYMSISWTQVLTEALLAMDFGYYMFEKVWEPRVIDGKRRIVWKKLAPRHPMDVKKWHYDSAGGPAGVEMYADSADPSQRDVTIDIDKLLVFTFDKEASNIEGISVLRSAYKHWYYKEQLYKIDAIQKERHGIGIPVIKLPVNFSKADRLAADDLGRNLRTNERAHVVLPPNWELLFAEIHGNPVDVMKSIEHHDARIRENVIATFLGDAKTTKEEDQTMFLKASRVFADIICDTFNTYAIPQLVDYNFTRVKPPRLRARRIGEAEEQRMFSFALRNLVGAKVIVPDRALEDHARQVLDLPPVDEATRAEYQQQVEGANKQQGPDQPGLPRQTAPGAQPPQKNGGTDQSGKSGTKK